MNSEVKKWSRLATLTGLRACAELAPWLVSLSFIGHVSTTDLAALSLVELYIYTFVEIVWTGISTTESVLVSQAHGRSSLTGMRGWAYISIVLITICNVILMLLCVTAKEALHSFGFRNELSSKGAVYAFYMIPALFTEGLNICGQVYLVSMQEAFVPTFIEIAMALVDIFFTYLFIFGLGTFDGFGNSLQATAVAWVVSSAIGCTCTYLAIYRVWGKELTYGGSDGKEYIPLSLQSNQLRSRFLSQSEIDEEEHNSNTDSSVRMDSAGNDSESDNADGARRTSSMWNSLYTSFRFMEPAYIPSRVSDNKHSFSVDSYCDEGNYSQIKSWISRRSRWPTYFSLAGPNFFSTALQSISFFIMSFLAAQLGEVALAAHNTNIALFQVVFTIVQGMNEATCIRIGYHIGRGAVEDAKHVMKLSLLCSTVWGISAALLGYFLRYQIAECLSNDPEVIAQSVRLSPLVWGAYAIFSIGGQALAILDGQGRAKDEAMAFLVGTWLVSVPLYLISYFSTDSGLYGIWLALIVGYMVTEAIAGYMIYYSNWDDIISVAKQRMIVEAQVTDD